METIEMVRYFALLIAGFVLFMTAVFRKNTKFHAVYATMVGWRLAITAIYTFVIWGGISLILFAIDKLLGINIDSRTYFDTVVLTTGMFAPVFFFGGIPESKEELLQDNIYKFFKIMIVYVVAPLLTAYTVVFYLYGFRILSSWNWPDGIVGNMVLWYSVIGIVTMFFLRGMDTTGKWASLFGKWFPRIILLPIVLLFISLIIRINSYGFTINRYLLGAAGIWTLGCALYMSIVNYKTRRTKIITVSIVVIALLSVIGPWGAINVGRVSQSNRLEKLLQSNNMLKDGAVIPNSELSESIKGEISEKIRFLKRQYNNKGVDFLPVGFEIKDMKTVFGFAETFYYDGEITKQAEDEYISIRNNKVGNIISVSGYTYMWDSEGWTEASYLTADGILKFEYSRERSSAELKIYLNKIVVFSKDIKDFSEVIKSAWEEKGDELTPDDMTFTFENSYCEGKIIFTGTELYKEKNKYTIGWTNYYVLINIK
jgi:hypothetical protein